MFFRVVFVSHLVACLWWGLTYGVMDGPHWFNNPMNTPDQLEWASFQDQYIVALYWTIQTLTTTGYGDLVPANDDERILCLVILVVGATVFSYVVAHISELVQSFNHSEGDPPALVTIYMNPLIYPLIVTELAVLHSFRRHYSDQNPFLVFPILIDVTVFLTLHHQCHHQCHHQSSPSSCRQSNDRNQRVFDRCSCGSLPLHGSGRTFPSIHETEFWI